MSDHAAELIATAAEIMARCAHLNATIASMHAHDLAHPDTPYTEEAYLKERDNAGVGRFTSINPNFHNVPKSSPNIQDIPKDHPLINKVIVIQVEPDQQCDLCGKIAELRPYGPNGECVCFECGMKDEPAAYRAMNKRLGFPDKEDQK